MNQLGTTAGIGILALALGLAGCAQQSGTEQSPTTVSSPTGQGSSPTSTDTTSASAPATSVPARNHGIPIATAQQALQTAAQAVANGRPFDLETDTHDGQRVFEIKVASNGNETKVLVAEDGKQIVAQKPADKPSDDVAKVQGAQIDAGRALQTATEREPDAALSEMEIDTNHDGVVVWEVELVRADGSEVQIDVDAQNGSVLPGR